MTDAADHRKHPTPRSQSGEAMESRTAPRSQGHAPALLTGAGSSAPDPWQTLFTRDVDAMVDDLCAGVPRDFVSECREHVRDNAYFIEDGRLAAKTIAAVVSLAGAPFAACMDSLETIVEESTADILHEGPLDREELELSDEPCTDPPPLPVLLSRRLGVSVDAVLRVIPELNALEFDERHALYHMLVVGRSPSEYAERFGYDRHLAGELLTRTMRLAVAAS